MLKIFATNIVQVNKESGQILSYTRRPNYSYMGKSRKNSLRFYWKHRTISFLRENGPSYTSELIKKLKVPAREKRTFQRALGDLRALEVIKEKEGKNYLMGQEPPEEIEAKIKTKNIELNIPLKREQAKSVIQELPSIKNKPEAKKVLERVELI